MKKVTHLQYFKYLASFVKVNILRNSLECLHMIFIFIFFSATILQYKQLNLGFYLSIESYNEEQEILHYGKAFLSLCQAQEINYIESTSLIFF